MWTLPKFDWPQQKQQCLTCAHYRPFPDLERYAGGGTVMCCAANPWKGRRGIGSCIDNRHRGPCGIDAKLWKGLDMKD